MQLQKCTIKDVAKLALLNKQLMLKKANIGGRIENNKLNYEKEVHTRCIMSMIFVPNVGTGFMRGNLGNYRKKRYLPTRTVGVVRTAKTWNKIAKNP